MELEPEALQKNSCYFHIKVVLFPYQKILFQKLI